MRSIGMVLLAIMLLFSSPAMANAASSGDFINPNAGQPVTVPANQWHAGEVFWSQNGDQRIDIGSNRTTANTEFNYTVDSGLYNGTRGVYADSETDAKVRAILLAEGEANNAALYKNPVIQLYGVQVYPNDQRTMSLTVPANIVAGQAINIQVYAPEFVQLRIEFGDGTPDMILGPQHGLTQGVVEVPHVYNTGSFSIRLSHSGGRQVVANTTASNAQTNPTGDVTITAGATAVANGFQANEGANITFRAMANTPGTYCLWWNLQGTDKFCGDVSVAGGEFTAQHVFPTGTDEMYVKLMNLAGDYKLDEVYIRFNRQGGEQPTNGQVSFKNLDNPAATTYGAMVSFDFCVTNGQFDGVVDFGDGQNTGRLVITNECRTLRHQWVNQSGRTQNVQVTAIRTGQTSPAATLNVQIKSDMVPQVYSGGMVFRPFVPPTVAVSNNSPARGETVRINVTATSATQIWVDYGNNNGSGEFAMAAGQTRTFETTYAGDPARDAVYPIVVSYKDENGTVQRLPAVNVTTRFRR